LLKSYAVSLDSTTYSLTLSATVEYVGLSADGYLYNSFDLGSTYWLDLQPFAGVSDGISAPGSCGNRRASDYSDDLSFADYWSFTVKPMDLENAATADRMAYPPSDWSLTAVDCHTVKYERTFSLADLTACTDADGETLVSKEESTEKLSVEGAFFVDMVSPYSMADSDYYRSYNVLEYQFAIQFNRYVDTLASTGMLLFSSVVTGFSFDDDGQYRMTVLTQSADYISLTANAVVVSPVTVSGITVAEVTSGCLVTSSIVCDQIFAVTIPSNIDCAASTSFSYDVVDLSGLFQIAFGPQCRQVDGADVSECTQLKESLDDSGTLVLDVEPQFVDETCGVNLFDAAFGADLTFYTDDQFSASVADDGSFVIAQDTIYGQVEVTLPSDDDAVFAMNFVDVTIENVYVCTAADGTDLSASLSASDGTGGCLSSLVDTNGLYTVIGSGADAKYEGKTGYAVSAENVARFSFSVFDTARSTISVQVEVLLTMQTENRRRRQRMLLEDVGSNQIRHFLGTVSIVDQEEEGFSTEAVVGMSIGGTAIVAVLVFLVMVLVKRAKGGKAAETEMTAVVHVPEMSPSEVAVTTGGATVNV